MAAAPMRECYGHVQWAQGPEAARHMDAWRRGQTGFPLVDAGRQPIAACVLACLVACVHACVRASAQGQALEKQQQQLP